MVAKIMHCSLTFIAFVFLFAQMSDVTDASDRRWDWEKATADGCRWMNNHIGWACDNAPLRAMWRGYNRIRYGVTDCNTFCQRNGRSGGQCINNGNYDISSWCPEGFTCTCY